MHSKAGSFIPTNGTFTLNLYIYPNSQLCLEGFRKDQEEQSKEFYPTVKNLTPLSLHKAIPDLSVEAYLATGRYELDTTGIIGV